MLKESENISSVVILPQYDKYIRRVCILIAWKGLNANLLSCFTDGSLNAIDSFYDEYYKLLAKYGANDIKNSPEYMKLMRKYDFLIKSRRVGNELYKMFKENGYEFGKAMLGDKENGYEQFKKAGCLALFGENNMHMSEGAIKKAALFVIRDFFRYINNWFVENDNSMRKYVDEFDELMKNEEEAMASAEANGVSLKMMKYYFNLKEKGTNTMHDKVLMSELYARMRRDFTEARHKKDMAEKENENMVNQDVKVQDAGEQLSEGIIKNETYAELLKELFSKKDFDERQSNDIIDSVRMIEEKVEAIPGVKSFSACIDFAKKEDGLAFAQFIGNLECEEDANKDEILSQIDSLRDENEHHRVLVMKYGDSPIIQIYEKKFEEIGEITEQFNAMLDRINKVIF